jgi:hypothetical protein
MQPNDNFDFDQATSELNSGKLRDSISAKAEEKTKGSDRRSFFAFVKRFRTIRSLDHRKAPKIEVNLSFDLEEGEARLIQLAKAYYTFVKENDFYKGTFQEFLKMHLLRGLMEVVYESSMMDHNVSLLEAMSKDLTKVTPQEMERDKQTLIEDLRFLNDE